MLGLSPLIAHIWLAAGLLQLAAALFARDASLLRRAGRLGRAARRVDVQRLAQPIDETLFGQCPVAQLAAFVVDDHSDLRTEALDHALALHRSERRRCLGVEAQLDARVRTIGVLTTGPTRGRVRHNQLVARDPDGSGDGEDIRHEARLS